MSRIHEALKRAEQERAGQSGDSSRLPGAAVAAQDGLRSGSSETVEQSGSEGGFLAGTSVGPTLPNLSNGDVWLAQCSERQWSPDPRTMLFFEGEGGAAGGEEFRTLRSRLYQIRERQPLKKILITSAVPKEGKTFVSANLAQVLVQQPGRRALLIDGDLRGARLHLALGTSATPGLSDYLRGEYDEAAIIQRGPMPGLYFVPSGKVVPNPAELVSSSLFKKFMRKVEPLFDWIIIDSPPVVTVSDACSLATVCDGVLLVVRSNATPSDLARKAREEFSDKLLLGVVLNGIEAGASPYSRYYYGAYGYQPNADVE